MAFDIYGDELERGFCEVHPHIKQEYPCSQCDMERNQRNTVNKPTGKNENFVRARSYNLFCRMKECPNFIHWTFGHGSECFSCAKIGETMDIDEYPADCDFLAEIKEVKKL